MSGTYEAIYVLFSYLVTRPFPIPYTTTYLANFHCGLSDHSCMFYSMKCKSSNTKTIFAKEELFIHHQVDPFLYDSTVDIRSIALKLRSRPHHMSPSYRLRLHSQLRQRPFLFSTCLPYALSPRPLLPYLLPQDILPNLPGDISFCKQHRGHNLKVKEQEQSYTCKIESAPNASLCTNTNTGTA